jgi:hypothetical protein
MMWPNPEKRDDLPASELLALLAIFGIPVDIDDEHSGGHYEKKSDAWT